MSTQGLPDLLAQCDNAASHAPHWFYVGLTRYTCAGLATDQSVFDLDCIKCGGHETVIRYSKPSSFCPDNFLGWDCKLVSDRLGLTDEAGIIPEHFHRMCVRCRFSWPTFDCLPDPEELK